MSPVGLRHKLGYVTEGQQKEKQGSELRLSRVETVLSQRFENAALVVPVTLPTAAGSAARLVAHLLTA